MDAVPDLDLGPRPPRNVAQFAATPSPAAVAPAQPAAKLPSFAPPPMKTAQKPVQVPTGASTFDDDMQIEDGKFELDMGSGPPLYTPPAAQDSGDAPPEWERAPSAELADVPKSPPSAGGPRLVPTSPPGPGSNRGGALGVMTDRDAADRLADYGEVPSEVWKAPLYTYRVKMRQSDLRRQLVPRRESLAKAKAAEDDALIAFAERGRPLVAGNPTYVPLLSVAATAEGVLRQRDTALAAESDAHANQVATIDSRLSQLAGDLAQAKAEERSVAVEFSRADDLRQRAEAKVKRVEIELRNAVQRATPSGLPASPDAAAGDPEVHARTVERDARVAELNETMPAVNAATQKLGATRRKVAAAQQQVLDAKNERAALETQFKKRGEAHGAQVSEAQQAVRTALANLGRAGVTDEAAFGAEFADARKDIAALRKTTTTHAEEVALYEHAIEAYDKETVSRGFILLGVIGLVFLILASIPFVLHGTAAKPPPPPEATE